MPRTLLTAAEAAQHAHRARQALSAGAATVSPATVRKWVSRGHLAAAGLDERDRPLYALADIAAAEAATRGRALRLVGLPEGSAVPQRARACRTNDQVHSALPQVGRVMAKLSQERYLQPRP